MLFPDPFDDPKSPMHERAEAIEYWIMAALVAGAWIYGISCGVKSLF